MTSGADTTARILRALDAATAQLETAERERREPIAIIGIGCRFPGGANDPESYWSLLAEGRDAICELPADRAALAAAVGNWPRQGGFLREVDRFDAALFEISPREAHSLDPQQRILLETAWEALEHAGITRARTRGSRAGVFIGITNCDYGRLIARAPDGLDGYFVTGNTLNAAAGRIAYYLGLRGPALAVDTACSSSLVAVHLAVQALRARDCDTALVGGVNLILSPEGMIGLSQAHVLAPDGRCKTFDARANGMGRAEGCGVLVLKRLSDAERDGDDIWTLIHGSAVNQDGPSSGLTVPSGPAQQDVIRRALANAGIAASEIDYLEAHGTGTALGDPIEIAAIGGVFAGERGADDPLYIGSVKANIGHTESAAGIAAIIKLALCLRHRTIPPQPHFRDPNPHIDWTALPIVVPTRLTAWPARGKRALGGVSGFGFSGTNAHVVLGAAPSRTAEPAECRSQPELLVMSGIDAAALDEIASRYALLLGGDNPPLFADICFSAATTRDHHAERLAFVAAPEEAAALGAFRVQAGDTPDTTRFARGRARPDHPPATAFLFAGQGAQHAEMARRLLEPVFCRAVETCREILGRELFWLPDAGSIDATANAQPALFAFEYALARLWQSWGIEPAALIGHSVGEYAAACIAGVFSMEDALRLVAERGRLMAELAHDGAMAAVFGPHDRVDAIARDYPGQIAIAAINAPDNLVLSGDRTALADAVRRVEAEGIRCRPLAVSRAFHGPWMAPILDPFQAVLSRVRLARPQIPFVSTVTGRRADDEVATANYWLRQIMEPVRFAAGIAALGELGAGVFLEIGPHPTLVGHARAVAGTAPAIIAGLKRGEDDRERLLLALGKLYVAGAAIDWSAVYRDRKLRRVALPTYPFQRNRYWFAERAEGDAAALPPLWEVRWVAQPLAGTAASATRWLVLGNDGSLGEALAARLRCGGEHAAVLYASRAGEIDAVLAPLLADRGSPPLHLVHLWSLDEPVYQADAAGPDEASDRALQLSAAALRVIQAVLRAETRNARLWLVTRGAQAIGSGAVAVAAAALWGLGRTAALEHPEIFGGLIDLDPCCLPEPDALLAELHGAGAERQVAYRNGRRLVARLAPVARNPLPTKPLDAAGSYLITGGLGGLGLAIAEWMAANGARHIVLVGRRAPGAEARRRLETLIAAGTDVRVVAADIAQSQGAERAVAAADGAARLRGIVHAAGVLDDGMLLRQTRERFAAVMSGKAQGAIQLDWLTRGRDLDFFVLLSSAAALLGSPGQGNYAAANAVLDALAAERRRIGETALSTAWGPWAETGMAARLAEAQRAALDAGPLSPLSVARATQLFGGLLGCDKPHIAAMAFNPARLDRQRHAALLPLVADLLPREPPEKTPAAAPQPLPADRRAIIDYLQKRTRALLRLRVDEVLLGGVSLQEQGVDSIMAMELRNRIVQDLGEDVPIARFLDGSTIEGLANLLQARLALTRAATPFEAAAQSEIEEMVL